MATTHDMRYEGEQNRSSKWSWLLPVALLLLAALALSSYLANRNDPAVNGTANDTYLNTPAQGELNTTPSGTGI